MRSLPQLSCVAILTSLAGPGFAIDINPGDFAVVPSGTLAALAYLQGSTADNLKLKDGTKVPDSSLDTAVGILRLVYYSQLGEVPVAVQAIQPFANLDVEIGGAEPEVADGVGDLILGFTFWGMKPDSNASGTTLGFASYLYAPTGNFDTDKVSLGQGGWSFAQQVGLIQPMGGGWSFEAAFDVTWYEKFTEDGIEFEKDPVQQLQIYLTKAVSETTSVSFGYSGKRGGDSSVDGVDTGLEATVDQVRLYGSHFFNPVTQLQAGISRDFDYEGGFGETTALQLRLLRLF